MAKLLLIRYFSQPMALYTKLNKKQIGQLAQKFGLPPPLSFKGIVAGTVNTYYRLHYKDKNYYLKVDEVADKKRLLRELHILEELEKARLPFRTPVSFVRAIHELPLQNKKTILLFEEIHGKSLFGKNLKPKHLIQAGRALAQIHVGTKKGHFSVHRFDIHGQKHVFNSVQKKLQKKHPSIHLWVKNKIQELEKKEPLGMPSGLIHADLFPENILYGNNKLHGILDFEAAGKEAFLFDVCVAIHACCHDGKDFDLKKIKAVLTGYTSVRRFTKKEKNSFGYYLDLSAIRFLLTRLRDFELKDGVVKASPFKDYREYVKRFEENQVLIRDIRKFI